MNIKELESKEGSDDANFRGIVHPYIFINS
jgi:hypothetical protein